MYSEQVIVEVVTKRKDSFVLVQYDWMNEQRGKTTCRHCGNLLRSVFPNPVDVWLRYVPPETSYHGVFQGGVGLIHIQLLDFLRLRMPDCVIGRCFGRDGKPLTEYRTVYMPRFITVRAADKKSNRFFCHTCGIPLGTTWVPYLLRPEIPEGEVFQDAISCLYLDAELARKFPWKRFRDVEPFMIPVRDEVQPDDPFPYPLPGQQSPS